MALKNIYLLPFKRTGEGSHGSDGFQQTLPCKPIVFIYLRTSLKYPLRTPESPRLPKCTRRLTVFPHKMVASPPSFCYNQSADNEKMESEDSSGLL